MALRVSDSEVKEIISTDITDTTPFITAANLIITAKLSGEGLSDAYLKELERWLAAHMVAARDQGIISEKTGAASVTYFAKVGLGLDGSTWGQRVKLLDTTGILASLGKKKVIFKAMPE